MARFAVVCDTNFYRASTELEIVELVDLESQAGIRPVASFLTCSELLSHVADPTGRDHRPCRAAVRRLLLHCTRGLRFSGPLRIIADPNGLIAYSLFNRTRPNRQSLARSFAMMVRRVGVARSDDRLGDISNQLAIVKKHRDDAEARFTGLLADIRRQFGLDPTGTPDFETSQRTTPQQFIESGLAHTTAASALVLSAAEEHGIVLSEDAVRQLGQILLPEARTAVDLFVERLRKVLFERANPANQGNFIWDIYFALLAATRLKVNRVDVVLVTNDHAIRNAADSSGGGCRVLTPAEYRNLLQSPS